MAMTTERRTEISEKVKSKTLTFFPCSHTDVIDLLAALEEAERKLARVEADALKAFHESQTFLEKQHSGNYDSLKSQECLGIRIQAECALQILFDEDEEAIKAAISNYRRR